MNRPPVQGTVVVTGASSGIGEALARRLGRVAGRLVLVARRRERLDTLAAALRAARPALVVDVVPADLADPASVDALLTGLGDVDVLVNNAGLGDLTLFERSEQAKNDQMIAVNIAGLVRLTHALVPGMVARGRGAILNVGSSYGLSWTPGAAVYIGTKHFVHGFSQSLRSELRPAGVVVTELCPGPVATEFTDVAGVWSLAEAPRFLMQDADACARAGLRGLASDKAVVIPALSIRLLMAASGLTPAWLYRAVMAPFAWWLRR